MDYLLRVLRLKCLLHAFLHLPSLLSHSSVEGKYSPLNVKIKEIQPLDEIYCNLFIYSAFLLLNRNCTKSYQFQQMTFQIYISSSFSFLSCK